MRTDVEFFSVNTCGKASNTFRFDSNFYAFVVVVNVCTTLTQVALICHMLLLLCFLFHLLKQTFIFPLLPTINRKKINVGAEGVRGGGRPGPIWINGEFVAVHASIMRLNETRRGAKWIQKFVCRA